MARTIGQFVSALEVNDALTNVSATVYTITNPYVSSSLKVYINGVLRTLTTDYTVSGQSITFVTALVAGQVPNAVYLRSN